MDDTHVDLSVLTLARGSSERLIQWLRHIEVQTFPAARMEVLLVDCGVADDTSERIQRYAAGMPVAAHWLRGAVGGDASARNLGVREARGRIVLFLDETLLASRQLCARHAQLHRESDEDCVVVGGVRPHPQLHFTRNMPSIEFHSMRQFVPGQPLRYLDWRAHNLSLPKRAIEQAGGFSDRFDGAALEEIELAYRLESAGIRGLFDATAEAFVWLSPSLEDARIRHIREGYGFGLLIEDTNDKMAQERIRQYIRPWRAPLENLIAPALRFVCGRLGPWTTRFEYLGASVCRAAFWRAYSHARKHRPMNGPSAES